MAAGISQGDAQQHNRNLVLSPTARADTRPQLDIRADDVKAAHGATVGRLDEDEMLYLRLRGLDAATASALLTTGYIAEVESRLPEALR
jgi:Fe-S cluster assembly protein SufD